MRIHALATLAAAAATALLPGGALAAESSVRVTGLTTEHAVAPIGIDAPAPRLGWQLTDAGRGTAQSAYELRVSDGHGHDWDSGRVASSQSVDVPARAPAASGRRYRWQVRVWDQNGEATPWSDPASLEYGLLDPSDWTARWIGNPDGSNALLRKSFNVDGEVVSARAYVSAMGAYVLHLNGHTVSDHVLEPDVTDPSLRVPYATYDITRAIAQGENVIGADLGLRDAGTQALLAQLVIRYADGRTQTIPTGPDWSAADSPTVQDTPIGGELYEGALEQPGWDAAGFDDSNWSAAAPVPAPAGRLFAEASDPVKVIDTLKPVSVTPLAPGNYLFDFGKLVSGWAALNLSIPAGTQVTVKYYEAYGRQEAGAAAIEGAKTDTFIAGQTGRWESQYSYTGFQYVELDGLPSAPGEGAVLARQVASAVPAQGGLSTGSSLVNQIHDAMRLTILDNLHWIPTDTPTFEQRGWMADAALVAPSAIDNFGMERVYEDFLSNIRAVQRPNGDIPVSVLPDLNWYGAPDWQAAYPLIAWYTFENYGDTQILQDNYAALKRFVDWELTQSSGGLWGSQYGDWLAPGFGAASIENVNPEGSQINGTAYAFLIMKTFARIAGALGHSDDAAHYAGQAANIRSAFNAAFLNSTAGFYNDSQDPAPRQTSDALGLAFGLVPDANRQAVADNLARDVIAHGEHLDTGATGTQLLLPALSAGGYNELAQAVATQSTYPSWGYFITQGSSTMWESWEDTTRSRAHAFKGTIDQWLYSDLAGISPDAAGYRHFIVKPRPGRTITSARAWHASPYGRITSSWSLAGDQLQLDVTVPPNSTATVYLPTSDPASVKESGHSVAGAPGLQPAGTAAGGFAAYEAASGTYHFTATLTPACATPVCPPNVSAVAGPARPAARAAGARVTPRATKVAPKVHLLYDFEHGTAQGWQGDATVSGVSAGSSFANRPKRAYDGGAALVASLQYIPALTPHSIYVQPTTPIDLSHADAFFLWFNSWGGLGTTYQAKITLVSSDGQTLAAPVNPQGQLSPATGNALTQTFNTISDHWQRLTIPVGSWSGKAHVTEIQVTFSAPQQATPWGAQFELDDVGWVEPRPAA